MHLTALQVAPLALKKVHLTAQSWTDWASRVLVMFLAKVVAEMLTVLWYRAFCASQHGSRASSNTANRKHHLEVEPQN